MTRGRAIPAVCGLLVLALGPGCTPRAAGPAPATSATASTPAAATSATAPADGAPAADDEGAGSTDAERAKRLFAAGTRALGSRPPDARTAVDKLVEAVRLQDSFPEAWCNLGLAHMAAGELDKAISALQKATYQKPDLAVAWAALGDAYARSRQPVAATNAYEQGIKQAPDDPSLRVRLIDQLRARGQREQAIQQAKEVLRLNSNSVEAYNILGLTYLDAREFELARFVFVKALNSVPGAKESAAIHANLGLVYFHLERPFDAEAELTEALRLDADLVGALVSMSYLKLRNLDFAGARELLDRAARQEPDSIEVRLNMGVARRGQGDFEGARAEYEKVLAADPANPDALLNLGILYADFLKDYDKAIATYNQYLKGTGLAAADTAKAKKYIEEVEKTKTREERRREQDRRRKEREAAKQGGGDAAGGSGSEEPKAGGDASGGGP